MKQTIKYLKKYTNRKSTMPILSQACCYKGSITVTDFDTWVTVADLPITGQGCIDLRLLDGVENFPSIEFDAETNKAKCGSLTIPFIDVDEYPNTPTVDLLPAADFILGKDSAKRLAWVLKAASSDDTRFNLKGVIIDAGQFIATDGHRLHRTKMYGSEHVTGKPIIPTAGIKCLIDSVKAFGELTVKVAPGWLVAFRRNLTIKIRLIDGEFPDYNMVIPKNRQPNKILVQSKPMIKALVPVLKLVSDKDKGACISVHTNGLHIDANDCILGRYETTHYCEPVVSDYSFKFGMNCRYLIEALESSDGYQMIRYTDARGPFEIIDHDELSHAIVMPMRLKEIETPETVEAPANESN